MTPSATRSEWGTDPVPTFPVNDEFLAEVNGEPLDLPLRGHVFSFPGSPPTSQVAELREIQRKLDAQMRGEIPANTVVVPREDEFYNRLLGEQLPAMGAAGVTEAEKAHAAITVLIFYTQGVVAAGRYWSGQIQRALRERTQENAQEDATPAPKPAPKRATARKAPVKAGTRTRTQK